jgi:hypothetical protein
MVQRRENKAAHRREPARLWPTAQTVTISSYTPGATIIYTTDGTTPGEQGGTPTGAGTAIANNATITVNATMTLQAFAYHSGYSDSTVASAVYTLQCAIPTLTPSAGTYATPQTITINSATPEAAIIYTTDGTTPGEQGGTPTGSGIAITNGATVTINSTATLQAIAYQSGYADSAVVSGVYTITPIISQVTLISPVANSTIGGIEIQGQVTAPMKTGDR